MRDAHVSLKNKIIKKAQSANAEIVLVQLQWGKEDIGHNLHVSPNTFSTSGLQSTDFLSFLQFERSSCSFVSRGECYFQWVDSDFDVDLFANLFDKAFQNLKEAQRDLEKCGFFFTQPEGWGYFFGKEARDRDIDLSMSGNGHAGRSISQMKQSEDEIFQYRFTWIENNYDKGWVIHYRPKHLPVSSEIESVFKFLGLQIFPECPEFDFEQCHFRSIKFTSKGYGAIDSNANSAHSWFDAHAQSFSVGIKKLLTANAEIEKCGLRFLPFSTPKVRLNSDIEKRTLRPKSETTGFDKELFDVAILSLVLKEEAQNN